MTKANTTRPRSCCGSIWICGPNAADIFERGCLNRQGGATGLSPVADYETKLREIASLSQVRLRIQSGEKLLAMFKEIRQ